MTAAEYIKANFGIDKLAHIVIGLLVMFFLYAAYLVSQKYGQGPAVALCTTVMGIGLELYQKVRHEGTPDPWDAAATALPGFIFWAVR